MTDQQIRLLTNLAKALESGTPPERIKIDSAATAVALRAVLARSASVALLLRDVLVHKPELHGDADLQRRIDAFSDGGSIIGNG